MQKKSTKNSIERVYYKNVSLMRSLNGKADITPEQIKAARALLSWSQADLAKFSGYSVPAINNIEKGNYEARNATVSDVIQTFEKHNIEFIEGGVRNATDNLRVKCYEGEDGTIQMLKKLSTAFDNEEGELLMCGIDEKYIMENFPKEVKRMQTRISAHPDVKVRILCKKCQSNGLTFKNFQKKVVPDSVSLFPMFLYRKRVLTVLLRAPTQIILTYSPSLYNVYVEHFNYMWDHIRMPK